MPLLTPEQCREQCNIASGNSAHDAILADLLASAEDAASAYLNRAIFADEAAMTASLDELPDVAANAQSEYDTAMTAADSEVDPIKAAAMREVASSKLANARIKNIRTLNGITANASIYAAVRLTLGHLFENRESAVTGTISSELPFGPTQLLRPYRRVMMP